MTRKQARFGQPALYNATPPTLTDGDDSGLNVDASGNLKVNISSDTSTMGSSGSPVQVASSASSVTLAVANSSRKEIIIYNDSTSILYVKYGTTASNTSYTVQLAAAETLVETRYTGRIDGIWSSANGNAYVTEVS